MEVKISLSNSMMAAFHIQCVKLVGESQRVCASSQSITKHLTRFIAVHLPFFCLRLYDFK